MADLKDAQDHSGFYSWPRPIRFLAIEPSTRSGEPPPGRQLTLGPPTPKRLDDAVHSAAELLHDRGTSRRKIILLTPMGLNGPPFNRYLFRHSRTLLQRQCIVYSLAVGHSLKRKFSRLVNYANDSGGDIYYAVKAPPWKGFIREYRRSSPPVHPGITSSRQQLQR